MAAYLRDVVALTFPLVVGMPIVIGFELAESVAAMLGLAFLCGSAVTGLLLAVFGIAGLPMMAPELAGLLALWMLGAAWFLWRRRLTWSFARRRPPWQPVTIVFVALTIVNLLTVAVFALRTQLTISDVINVWIPKADALARAHSLLSLAKTTFPDYPPVWPLHLFLSRVIAGHLVAVKLLPTLYLASLLAVVFGYLSKRTSPLVASATVWVISGIPYLWFPYGTNDLMAEIPFAAFFIASVVCLARYIEDDPRQLFAGMLLATAATMTRPEGIQHAMLIAILAGIVAWRRRRWNPVLVATVIPLILFAVWHLAVLLAPHARGYAVDPHRILQVVTPSAIADIAGYTVHWLANPFVFGPTVIAAALCAAGYRSWRSTWPWLTMFVLSLAAIAATYLIAPASNDQPLSWWLATGYKRLLLHIVPLLFIAAALAAGSLLATPAGATDRTRQWRWIGPAVGAFVLVVAAVFTIAIRGAGPVVLATVAPNGVVGASLVPGRVHGADGFSEDSGAAADWNQLQVAASAVGSVSYDLSNLAERLSPNDQVVGRFTSVTARVLAAASGDGMRLEAAANNRVIGSAQAPSGGPMPAFNVGIPPDARTVSLIAVPSPDGSSVQALSVRAVLNRGGAWPLVALLLLLATVVAVISAVRAPHPDPPPTSGGRERRDLGRVALVALVLLAVLVQQADVLTNQAVPLWSEAAHTLVHQLRSH